MVPPRGTVRSTYVHILNARGLTLPAPRTLRLMHFKLLVDAGLETDLQGYWKAGASCRVDVALTT